MLVTWTNKKVGICIKKIVIATHGILADGYKNTLDILGIPQDNINVMNFYCGTQHNEQEIHEIFASLKEHEQMIVFTDIQFGSVNQMFVKQALDFPCKNIAILTGMNLPLMLEVILAKEELSEEMLQNMVEKAAEQMTLVDLNQFKQSQEEDIF